MNTEELQNLNPEELDSDTIDELERKISTAKRRYQWSGKGGIYSTLRDIATDYARKPHKEVSKIEKLERTENALENLLDRIREAKARLDDEGAEDE
jgi:hypothetical protein